MNETTSDELSGDRMLEIVENAILDECLEFEAGRDFECAIVHDPPGVQVVDPERGGELGFVPTKLLRYWDTDDNAKAVVRAHAAEVCAELQRRGAEGK